MDIDFFDIARQVTVDYCAINGLPVPKLYPCAGYSCWSRVEKRGGMCEARATKLDGQIVDREERGLM